MIWSQFSTKKLQITILDIKNWDKNKYQYSKQNSSLEQRFYIYIIKSMISIKRPQKGRKKNCKSFSRITKRYKLPDAQSSYPSGGVSLNLNPLKISKNPERLINDPNALSKNLVPYQLNLMLNSNQVLASFRRTLTLSRQKIGQT